MNALRLDARYLAAVLDGTKTTTIRRGRRDVQPGQVLYFVTDDQRGARVRVVSVKYLLAGSLTMHDWAAMRLRYNIEADDVVTIIEFRREKLA